MHDILPRWHPRFIGVRGIAEAFAEGDKAVKVDPATLRFTSTRLVSMGINDDLVCPGEGSVNCDGLRVT